MTDQAMSPLRRRMIEDMTIRKFAPKTQHDYLQMVKNFTAYLGRSPDTASFEDLRRYQLHLATNGAGVPTLNQTISTLRFFFKVTLGRPDIVERTAFVHEPSKLPARNDTASTTCADASEPQPLSHPCPCCGGRMIVIETFERGSSPRHRPAASPTVIRIDTS